MNTPPIIDTLVPSSTNYGFAVGKIRVLETRLIDRNFFNNLIMLDNLGSAISRLQETPYSMFLKDKSYWEKGLESNYNYTLNIITKIVPEPGLIKILRLRYDFHNIKIIFKSKLNILDMEKFEYFLDLGTIDIKTLSDGILKEKYSLLPEHIVRVVKDTWHRISKDKDPQLVTILLDRWLYHTLFHEAERKNTFLERFFSTWIDLYNIKTFLRAKKLEKGKEFFDTYFLHHGTIDRHKFKKFYEDSVPDIIEKLVTSPYFEIVQILLSTWAQDRSLIKVDKAIDDFITRILRRSRLKTFGIEPIISYIWAKEMELKNCRLILTAIQYGLDKDWTMQHIREVG